MRHLLCFLLFLCACDVDSVGGWRGNKGKERMRHSFSVNDGIQYHQRADFMSQFARCEFAANNVALRKVSLEVGNTAMWMLPGLYAEYVSCRRLSALYYELSQTKRIQLVSIVSVLRAQFEERLKEVILYESDLPILNYAVVRMYSDGDFSRDGRAGIVLDAMVYLAVEHTQPESIGLTTDQLIAAYQKGLKELYYYHLAYWSYDKPTNPEEYFGAKNVLCTRILRQYQPFSVGESDFDALLFPERLRYPSHGFSSDQLASLGCE